MIFFENFFAMKTCCNFYQPPAKTSLPGVLPVLILALLAVAMPLLAVPVAGSFVEGLQGFIPVDTRVDSSIGTPTSGTTYLLGRDDASPVRFSANMVRAARN